MKSRLFLTVSSDVVRLLDRKLDLSVVQHAARCLSTIAQDAAGAYAILGANAVTALSSVLSSPYAILSFGDFLLFFTQRAGMP